MTVKMRGTFLRIISTTLVILILKLSGEVLCDEKYPHLKIPSGDLHGIYLKTPKGKTYEAYLGVPYAKAPFGELRFKEAQHVRPWTGSYNASKYGSDCLQFTQFGYTVTGSEDCLFMNIYKPVRKLNKVSPLLDVIVHIHGGAFMFFNPRDFRPDKLMDHDIVYASFNYRLGPLGFLSTGDKVLPGNLGLKDQVFALKWVRDNIEYFGGDPNKVTLSGVSAGGASVHYHYLSPLSRGLFHKGISGSGAALTPWALTEKAPEKAKIIASKLGCPTGDSATMVKCLSERPAEQIVAQVPLFLAWLYNPFTSFGPVIEADDSESPFITRHPYDIIKSGDLAHVPWLCSFNSEEGLYPAAEFVENPESLIELESKWYEYAPHLLDYNFTVLPPTDEQRNQITDNVTKHYMKNKRIKEGVKELIQMIGDRLFSAGIVQSALVQGSVSKTPVYLYRFSYRGKYSSSEAFSHSNTNFGVCHGDDSGYIYHGDIYNMDQTEDDRSMGKRLINLFLSFAKTGIPEFFENQPLPSTNEGLPKIRYFDINSPSKAKAATKSDLAEVNFWSTLPLQEKLQSPSNSKDEL